MTALDGGGSSVVFEKYLASRGMKLSRPRRLVMIGALDGPRHFSAESLYEFLKTTASVSRASVYRTLALLEESGLVRRVLYGEGKSHYEQQEGREHHDHLICISCGSVTEFVNQEIEALQEEVCRQHGFVAQRHNMQISGICEKCSKDPNVLLGKEKSS